MGTHISEQGGKDEATQKRIRQAVYDIRYKARKDELDLRHAYSQYIGKSGLDQNGKEAVQNKLFGKSQQVNAESNVLEAASSNKYKVRVKDSETGKTYVRFAKRSKINQLRSKGTVEMTGHGIPKGSKTSTTSTVRTQDRKVKFKKPPESHKPTVNFTAKAAPGPKMKKPVTKEAFIADAAAVAPPKNKKITGEKVDNTKLIKVFPQDGSDPNIGSIKSSYKPVGQVVSEILNPPQQVDEVVGQIAGGLAGATWGQGLAAKGLAKVAGAATKIGAPKAVGAALKSKTAAKVAATAAGSAAGEVLDPFKKKKDKNPVAAAVGGAAGGAIHGAIKSSYNPVGEVVSEILANEDMQKGYEVTNADKKANTPAWQGYLAGKKKKDGTPLYKKAAHMEEVGVSTSAAMEKAKKEAKLQKKEQGAVNKAMKKEEFVDPFYKSVPTEGDDGTGRSMYAKWNNVKNRLRSMGLKCNYDLEGDQLIEDAVEYFYEQGITEETIDLIVEEVGLDDFVEFVLDPHQDLVEARSARKAKANAPSYEKVKASVDASDAAKKKAGKGEYSKSYTKRSGETEDSTNYNDKPAAKKKAKSEVSSTKKAATKKKVTTAVKKDAKKDFDGDGKTESPKAEYKGSKDKAIKKAIAKKEGLRCKITSFVKKGVERHKKARAAGKVPEKRVKEFASGVKSGVKTAVKFAKDVKKVVSEEEERLRASGKFTEEQIEAILESEAIDEARRADKMGIPRKKVTYDKGEETRNPNPDRGAAPSFKPEGGSLAGSKAASRARSLGDARRKANRKGANLAYGKREGRLATFAANKRDSDSDLGSQKAATDTGAHKDKQGFRQVHKYGERGDKRRPQQNPKHTANTQKEHHQVDAKGKVIEHGDGTPSSVEEGFVCESTLVRNLLNGK